MELAILVSICWLGAIIALGLRTWVRFQEKRLLLDQQTERRKAMSSLRIAAYERLIIMIERTDPANIIMRYPIHSMTAASLQFELMKSIREEYEHNVSLQMYVSEGTWQTILHTKEIHIQLIKEAFQAIPTEATALELCNLVFQLDNTTGNHQSKLAIGAIRQEIEWHFV